MLAVVHTERRRPLVLVVEDHEDTRLLLHTLFTMHGFDVAECGDGRSAVDLATSITPSVIVLDGSLPDQDGLTVARTLRAREAGRNVPIVFVSGHATSEMQASALAAGCNHYLPKPVELDVLVRLVESAAFPPATSS